MVPCWCVSLCIRLRPLRLIFGGVSRKRLEKWLYTRNADTVTSSADIQILLHAMQLDNEEEDPEEHGRTRHASAVRNARYRTVKTALLVLENSAGFSTNFLAAYVLLAVYEVGHGLFPAAYLTVGNLTRIFCALGLHDRKNATQILPRPGNADGSSLFDAWKSLLTWIARHMDRDRRETSALVGSAYLGPIRACRLSI